MSKQSIFSAAVHDEIKLQIEAFNQKNFTKKSCEFIFRTKGRFIYLDLNEGNDASPICRLTYNGDLKNMDFAIFKYSSEKYDANDWFFPGSECVDGTLEGAMKAGYKAYSL